MSEPNARQVETMDLVSLLDEIGKVSARLTHALSEWAACRDQCEAWRARALKAEREARDAQLTVAQVRLWLESEQNVELLVQVVRRGLAG